MSPKGIFKCIFLKYTVPKYTLTSQEALKVMFCLWRYIKFFKQPIYFKMCIYGFLADFEKSWLWDINYESGATFPSKFRHGDIFTTWGVDWSFLALIQPGYTYLIFVIYVFLLVKYWFSIKMYNSSATNMRFEEM